MKALAVLPAALLLGGFFLLPLGSVFGEAFADGASAFGRILADPLLVQASRGSAVLAATAAALSVPAGLAVAFGLARLRPGPRMLMLFLVSLPLTFSGLVIAYGFILAYGRAGFVTMLLEYVGFDPVAVSGLLYSPEGLAFAYAYFLIPRVVAMLLPVVLNLDARLAEAAASLGASRWRTLIDVTLPELLPSLGVAAALCAAIALGAYGTALALVGTQSPVLPLLLYSRIAETGSDFPAAAAMAVLLAAACTAVMALGEIAALRRERARG